MKYFIANWKSHKMVGESVQWLSEFVSLINNDQKVIKNLHDNAIKIIICPPFSLLSSLKERLPNLPNIHLGSQTISSFDEGSYTGEVSGISLQGLVDYTIVGHSERRIHFNETNGEILKKIEIAEKYTIAPILCVRGAEDSIPHNVKIVAYEPPEYIGTGKTQELNKIIEIKKTINLPSDCVFLYGAGVTSLHVSQFLATDEIDGLLVGSASLNPKNFYSIVESI